MSFTPLQILNSLGLSIIFFDAHATPLLLTNNAARMLHIEQKDHLVRDSAWLSPLADFAEAALRTRKGLATDRNPTLAREIILSTADRRICSVLAEAILIEGTFAGLDLKGTTGVAIQIFELSLLEPMVEALDSIRRMRPYILSLASHSAVSLNDLMTIKSDLPPTLISSPECPSAPELTRSGTADLLRILTEAIDLVDPLLPPGVKITTDTRNSMLLDVSPPSLRHVIGQLLLEAADFASPAGSVSVHSHLPPNKQGLATNDQIDTTNMTLVIHSRRAPEPNRHFSPIERYLRRNVFPMRYKATIGAKKSHSQPLRSGTAPAEESLSDSLKLAQRAAKDQNLHIEVRRIRGELLELQLHIPLVQSKGPSPTMNRDME